MLRAGAEARQAIFPTFFMAGFECSTFVWKDGQRKDYVSATGHDRHLKSDLRRRWILALALSARQSGGQTSILATEIRLDERRGRSGGRDRVQDHADLGSLPLRLSGRLRSIFRRCRSRFVDYCRAAAKFVTGRRGSRPIFSRRSTRSPSSPPRRATWLDVSVREGPRRRTQAGLVPDGDRGREGDPRSRARRADGPRRSDRPRRPAAGRPDLADEARDEEHAKPSRPGTCFAGVLAPELGGSPEILDIVGVNVYNYSQVQLMATISGKCSVRTTRAENP